MMSMRDEINNRIRELALMIRVRQKGLPDDPEAMAIVMRMFQIDPEERMIVMGLASSLEEAVMMMMLDHPEERMNMLELVSRREASRVFLRGMARPGPEAGGGYQGGGFNMPNFGNVGNIQEEMMMGQMDFGQGLGAYGMGDLMGAMGASRRGMRCGDLTSPGGFDKGVVWYGWRGT